MNKILLTSLLVLPLFLLVPAGIGIAQPAADARDDDLPVLNVPPGFEAELLYSSTEHEQGSWVAVTVDPQGRLITSDQYGSLYRVTLKSASTDPAAADIDAAGVNFDTTAVDVERIDVDLGHAQGLAWAFNSLYVVVSRFEEEPGYRSGLYRVRDTDGDDQFDTVDTLRTFEGAGEHGPHSVVPGPDGESLYVIAGNHTELPSSFAARVPPVWRNDNLLPILPDPRGHAVDREAPGGWVARTDASGAHWELISVGFRNAYDLAFNPDGELFTFDSDMEWDLGMPWYRPIRVLHVTEGSDYGWRKGSGKWPAYYPDTLPSVVDVGQGSPTGVLSSAGSAFPERYRSGLFIFDWSYGTIYWVDLQPRGSSYTGSVEEFLSGTPLPLTDGIIGPDGAMYFLTGGRDLDSYLYRLSYAGEEAVGNESAEMSNFSGSGGPDGRGADERRLRRKLESLHGRPASDALDQAWPYLDHPDRFIRYAARVAVEQVPVARWKDRVLQEQDPLKRLYGLYALARRADAGMQETVLRALAEIDDEELSEAQRIDLLRTYGVLLSRTGPPPENRRMRLIDLLDARFPAERPAVNRELSQLLVFLEAPDIIPQLLTLLEAERADEIDARYLEGDVLERSEQYGPAVAEMLENMPPTQAIWYAYVLSNVPSGWTLAERTTYFRWLYEALKRSGGESYAGFIESIRMHALRHVPVEDREALAAYTGTPPEQRMALADLPQPNGPGRDWNPHDVMEVLDETLDEPPHEPQNFLRGQRMYEAALCASCHRMRGKGGNIGPDLTQVGTRFSKSDLVRAILIPSEAISDQYAATLLTLQDGRAVSGRIVEETEDVVRINENPYEPEQVTTIPKASILERERSPLSIMPPGLFNRLNAQEVADLMAYLLAGGDPEHEHFQPEAASSEAGDVE